MAVPVTKSEAELARKTAMPAKSAGSPQRLAGVRNQGLLRIESVHMAGRAAHEQRDNGLGARLEVRLLGRVRIVADRSGLATCRAGARGRAEETVLIQQISQRQSADSAAGLE